MNQILNTEQPKKRKQPLETTKIIKFFAISMIIYGIVIVGSSSYAIYKNSQDGGNSQAKPTISIEDLGNNQIKLEVTHTKPLGDVSYKWNSNGEETKLDSNGKKSVEETIEVPEGQNTLFVTASDQEGNVAEHQQQYDVEETINISFETEGNNLKITASGKNELSYMTYRWDEDEEQKININEIQTEQPVEIPEGEHTITVSVVDVNNNTSTKEQKVIGKKTDIKITTDPDKKYFIITANDDVGLSKIEILVDEDDSKKYSLDLHKLYPDKTKITEFDSSSIAKLNEFLALHEGENKLQITVYNDANAKTEKKNKVNADLLQN